MITNWKYINTENQVVSRVLDNGTIESRRVDSLSDWLLAGNTPDPADPQPISPAICSPWQIRKALNIAGLRQAVEAEVAASEDIALKDGWEFATELRSDDSFVLNMGKSIGKTADETRALIELASTL